MSNDKERGMMKYMPYQSLTEQGTSLRRMLYEKNKTEKPPMFHEKAEAINDILVNYHGQTVKLTYHRDGYPHEIRGVISKIYPFEKCLVINYQNIPFKEITDLSEIVD